MGIIKFRVLNETGNGIMTFNDWLEIEWLTAEIFFFIGFFTGAFVIGVLL